MYGLSLLVRKVWALLLWRLLHILVLLRLLLMHRLLLEAVLVLLLALLLLVQLAVWITVIVRFIGVRVIHDLIVRVV